MPKWNIVCAILTLLILSLAAGCASQRPKVSGFLGDYRDFEPAPKEKDALIYRKPGATLSALGRYDRVMIDPVVVWYRRDQEYQGIHPEELARLADDFHEAAIQALEGGYPVVMEPGPGTLRVRAAITDLVATKPALNAATFVGPGRQVSTLSRLVTGRHLFVGEATIEVELLDSLTNERLFAFVDRRVGNKINPVQGVSQWGHIRAAFDHWAGTLRKRLDEAHTEAK